MDALTPGEIAVIQELFKAIGSRFRLEFIVALVQRDRQSDLVSASNSRMPGCHEACENVKDLIAAAIAKKGIPVVSAEDGASAN